MGSPVFDAAFAQIPSHSTVFFWPTTSARRGGLSGAGRIRGRGRRLGLRLPCPLEFGIRLGTWLHPVACLALGMEQEALVRRVSVQEGLELPELGHGHVLREILQADGGRRRRRGLRITGCGSIRKFGFFVGSVSSRFLYDNG